MPKHLIVSAMTLIAAIACASVAMAQTEAWNNPGYDWSADELERESAPAPRRDLSGIWDPGTAGIGARGMTPAPFTPWGENIANNVYRPGDGPRMAPLAEVNDPLDDCDPAGFPRILLFELRPFQIVQTANQVLMLYMFEQRWRVIWTDGRELPEDPDPRWYGYSVGRWEDDYTFVVETVGMDERTWLDNAGNPHSGEMRVEERYQRVNHDTIRLTVTIDDPVAYTESWLARDNLPLRLRPADTDYMEMICSATEAAAYKRFIANPSP